MAAAVLIGAGVGAAFAPSAHGQTIRRDGSDRHRLVQMFAGHGAYIGVSIRDAESAEGKDVKPGAGVIVEDVSAESPAEKAGIKEGDAIVEFDGERVRSARQFTRLVQETVPGRPVPMAVLRAGQRVALTVQPSESGADRFFDEWDGFKAFRVPPVPPAPPAPPAAPRPPAPPSEPFEWFSRSEMFGGTGRLGIGVSELSEQLADYFGTKDGVLVTSVADDSTAARAGVKAGDVITSVNGGSVNSAADLRRRVQRLETGEALTLDVVRDKKPMTLKGKVEDRPARRSTRTIL